MRRASRSTSWCRSRTLFWLAIGVIALREETRRRTPLVLRRVGVCHMRRARCRGSADQQPRISLVRASSASGSGLGISPTSTGSRTRGRLVVVLGLGYVAVAWAGSQSYAAQIYMTIFALVLLYATGRRVSADSWWVGQVCLLGRYSLLGYIVQILLLQGVRVFDRLWLAEQSILTVVLVVIVSVMMWLVVVLVEWVGGRCVWSTRSTGACSLSAFECKGGVARSRWRCLRRAK